MKCISIRRQPPWPQNVCSSVLLGFHMWNVCVWQRQKEGEGVKSLSSCMCKKTLGYRVLMSPPHLIDAGLVYLILKSTLGFISWTHPPPVTKAATPPIASSPPTHPWITGFASIRAVLSWLKLYYREIRERLGDEAVNLPAGRAGELACVALGQPFPTQQKWVSV